MSNTQTAIENKKLPHTKELDAIKESLGEILLALQCPLTANERQELWKYFESLLAQYVERRTVEQLKENKSPSNHKSNKSAG